MKRKRVLLLTTIVTLLLCAGGGVWLHKERQQYALNRQLIAALENHDAKLARTLVNAGADPNTRYDPPLAPTIKFLLDQLLHPTPPPINNTPTALMFACGWNWNSQNDSTKALVNLDENLPLVQAMLAHGANVDARAFDNRTALHYASVRNIWHIVDLLIQHGANINARYERGGTPLLLAAWNNNVDVVRVLLAHGADPNLRDENGVTPLQLAQQEKRPEIIRLLKRGAK